MPASAAKKLAAIPVSLCPRLAANTSPTPPLRPNRFPRRLPNPYWPFLVRPSHSQPITVCGCLPLEICRWSPLILTEISEILGSMGRKRTQLSLTPAQRTKLAQRLQMVTEARAKDRLRFALLAAEGQHTLEDLAVRLGRARSTLQLWLDKFTAGGLAGLLERESPPGWLSPVGRDSVQAELQAGINAGRWRSAAAIAEWLQAAHGITRARKSIYYWLKRNGWAAPGVRPENARRI